MLENKLQNSCTEMVAKISHMYLYRFKVIGSSMIENSVPEKYETILYRSEIYFTSGVENKRISWRLFDVSFQMGETRFGLDERPD